MAKRRKLIDGLTMPEQPAMTGHDLLDSLKQMSSKQLDRPVRVLESGPGTLHSIDLVACWPSEPYDGEKIWLMLAAHVTGPEWAGSPRMRRK